jgi:hypothetical protein
MSLTIIKREPRLDEQNAQLTLDEIAEPMQTVGLAISEDPKIEDKV